MRRCPMVCAACIWLGAALTGCDAALKIEVGPSDPEAAATAIDSQPGPATAVADARTALPVDAAQDPARYAELLSDLEPWEIYRRCAALVTVRDQQRFDICFSVLTERIGDGTLGESGFGGREWNRAATVVRLEELRAEALLDRGELVRAEAAALDAAKAADDRPNYVVEAEAADWLSKLMSRADYGDPDQPFAHFRLRPLGLATAIAARRGDRNLARAYLTEIDAFDPALGAPGHAALWRRWKAIGHFTLGDYEQAYQVLTRGPDMGIGGAAYQAMVEIDAVDPQAAQLLPVTPGFRPLDPRYVMELGHDFIRLRSALETGRLEAAKTGLDELLSEDRLRDHPAIYVRVLRDRGRIAAAEGAYEGAIASFQVAIQAIEASRSARVTDAGILGGWNDRQALYADMIAAQIAIGRPEAAFAYAERARARALVDRLAPKMRFALAPPGMEEMLTLQARREERAAVLARRQEPVLVSQANGVGAFQESVRRQAPRLVGLVTVATLPVEEIQASLADDEALLAYFQRGDRLFGFALTRDALAAQELDGEDLDVLVSGFLRAIRNPRRRAYVSAARRLHEGLIQPFDAARAARRLVIVPHGALTRLPFAALRDETGFLIDRVFLRQLPSAQHLAAANVAPGPADLRLMLLDPPEPGQPSPDLPGAPLETAAVGRAWPGAVLAVGRGATETLLKNTDASMTHLHFAGRCDGEPALLLAADTENDGRVTLPELYDIRLGVRLAVLSRCHAEPDGAGRAELSEGFLRAGADAITVSLWPLADSAAAALMEQIYGELRAGTGAGALNATQRAMSRASRHPYYWAGFQWLGSAGAAPPPGEG